METKKVVAMSTRKLLQLTKNLHATEIPALKAGGDVIADDWDERRGCRRNALLLGYDGRIYVIRDLLKQGCC